MKRFVRYTIFGLAVLITVLPIPPILFYVEEDWRCSRDWSVCQAELADKGETFDLRQLAPPGKPEDDLSKTAIFAPLYEKEPDPNSPIKQFDVYLKATDSMVRPKMSGYQINKPLDLGAWQKFYRSLPQSHLSPVPQAPAQDILQSLGALNPQMDQVEKAFDNPNAYWPTDYTQPFMTILGGVTKTISIAQFLQLRAISHLESHEADPAEKDYLFSFRLHQPLEKRCFIVDYLIMLGVRAIDDSILWEGLRRHAWNNAQLHEMESALASVDMLSLAQRAVRTERAQAIIGIRYAQKGHKDQFVSMSNDNDFKSRFAELEMLVFLTCRPSGWDVQELTFLSKEMQKQIDSINPSHVTLNLDYDKNWVDPKTWSDWQKINFMMVGLLMGSYQKFDQNVARAETYNRLARLACRLEEYHIVHGLYPDALTDLPDLPAHLNQEVLSEEPLHYQRKDDTYTLYSVGWDQKDDDGARDPNNDKSKGDWPWPSP